MFYFHSKGKKGGVFVGQHPQTLPHISVLKEYTVKNRLYAIALVEVILRY